MFASIDPNTFQQLSLEDLHLFERQMNGVARRWLALNFSHYSFTLMDAEDLLGYRSEHLHFQPDKCGSLRLFVLKKDQRDIEEMQRLASTRVVSIDTFYHHRSKELFIFTRESMSMPRFPHFVQILDPSTGALVE